MAENSGIQWTDNTQNFWIGCRKVSPACRDCYAGTLVQNRMGKKFYPPADLGRVAVDADSPVWRTKTWGDPIRWNRAAQVAGTRTKVFTCSLSDFFLDHPRVHAWRRDAWKIMRDTPNLIWLVLSKRYDLGLEYIQSCLPEDWGSGYPNVMLGATVESQEQASRLDVLCSLPVRAGTFASCEPLLGPLDLSKYFGGWRSPLAWVIGGGESGSKARPVHPDWARGLRDQCLAARKIGFNVAFHWKQWGEWVPEEGAGYDSRSDKLSRIWRVWSGTDWLSTDEMTPHAVSVASNEPERWVANVGKKSAGRLLDGRTWDEFPDLEVSP